MKDPGEGFDGVKTHSKRITQSFLNTRLSRYPVLLQGPGDEGSVPTFPGLGSVYRGLGTVRVYIRMVFRV